MDEGELMAAHGSQPGLVGATRPLSTGFSPQVATGRASAAATGSSSQH